MFSFVIGLVVTMVGVTLMYILPGYVIGVLTATTTFNATDLATARTAVGQAQGLGFAVVLFGLIWTMISVIAGGQK